MRWVLRLLRTRYGASALLVLLVLIVVAVFRGTSGSHRPGSVVPDTPREPTTSVWPDGGYDGIAGTRSASGAEPPPISLSPSVAADAVSAATRFTTAWLTHTGVTPDAWRSAMRPLATDTLMSSLANTDPSRVPADRISGQVRLTVWNPTLVDATLPLDRGVLRLRLVSVSGVWKVDTIDWERPIS